MLDYFETTVMYHKELPTWSWLTAHGITPSNSTTYTLYDIESALTQEYSATPFVGCSGPRFNETKAGEGSMDNGRTEFGEVWYYFHVNGRPQDGNKVPVFQTGESTCATSKGAVHYYERSQASVVPL